MYHYCCYVVCVTQNVTATFFNAPSGNAFLYKLTSLLDYKKRLLFRWLSNNTDRICHQSVTKKIFNMLIYSNKWKCREYGCIKQKRTWHETQLESRIIVARNIWNGKSTGYLENEKIVTLTCKEYSCLLFLTVNP